MIFGQRHIDIFLLLRCTHVLALLSAVLNLYIFATCLVKLLSKYPFVFHGNCLIKNLVLGTLIVDRCQFVILWIFSVVDENTSSKLCISIVPSARASF